MVSAKLLLAATLPALAISNPIAPRQMDIPENWTWHIEDWEAGCARGGCYYTFNVTVPTVPGQIGGVKAYCSNGESNGLFQDCRLLEGVNNGVAAKIDDKPDDGSGRGPQNVYVSFLYDGYEDRPAYNFTGHNQTIYNQAVAPRQRFDVTPTEVFAIA
ncbi:hypothetical protein EJ04DRAFT_342388 [Polyplosphaeria fusca]|uniref:Uncharacterized protein n=1 Tax=Polyplosphaeria fusca TaxID=682080 RepID=A0A9P4V0I8_9PLEO|nr:hypothetical protein EJ04DRAFT_342388 [Polyplosphaeria fusca]